MSQKPDRRPAPASIDPRAPCLLALAAFASSVAIRGPRRSVKLLVTSLAVAAGAEVLAIRGTRGLRHHSQPQLGELPLSIPLMWYVYAVPCYSLAQAAAGDRGADAVCLVTALLATATDLANDPMGLAGGLWEWRDGGPYMPDIAGANGVAGIPIANYAAWLLIMASVARLMERDGHPHEVASARAWRTPLLLAYWLLGSPGLGWAAGEHRWGLLASSSLAVLGGGAAAWYAGRK